ncbi:hypothetical protein K443DRAFT_677110 [Laccaria amethystina LaAM-08-1]|uniref:Uncharacterized protein n=1 Tax=Laccaria amethystina LaAM-08-1 TaxID=1095629 RepID=A0A0C9XN88_9AGAR|nr:hypothetical protein K443DRAFT_677110 [Laccaria amethystina LaAM-08-1]
MSPQEQPCIMDNSTSTIPIGGSFYKTALMNKVSDPRRAWQLNGWPNFKRLTQLKVTSGLARRLRAFLNSSRGEIAIFFRRLGPIMVILIIWA